MSSFISDFLRTAMISLAPLLVSAALLLLLAVCGSGVIYFMGVIRLCREAVDLYLENHDKPGRKTS